MKLTRIYADQSGETHFADEELPLHDAGQIGRLSDAIPARAVVFRKNDPGYDYDWHDAPQRQFIALLDGGIEIEVSDGARRQFMPGEVLLVEDTTGKGHRSRNLKNAERSSLFIILEPMPAESEHPKTIIS